MNLDTLRRIKEAAESALNKAVDDSVHYDVYTELLNYQTETNAAYSKHLASCIKFKNILNHNAPKYLRLEIDLEACSMGINQEDIANYIESRSEWLEFVESVNQAPIPAKDLYPLQPTDDWYDSLSFHPDNLIDAACKALGWISTPTEGGLTMNFTAIKEGGE